MLRTFAALLAFTILLTIAPRPSGAQDTPATPVPAATPVAADAEFRRDILLRATIDRSSAEPVVMRLLRIVLEPEGFSPLHAHPGLELGIVESGTLTVRVEGRAVLLRADAAGDDASEPVPTGVEVSLGPGDRIAYAPGTLMTFRNSGPDPTSLLAATVLPTGPDAPPGAIYPGGLPTAEDTAGIRSFILGEVEAELPQRASAVLLERLQLTSGDVVPAFVGPVLAVIEEGALTGNVLGGAFELPGTSESVAPEGETELSLAAGESIFFPNGMAATAPLGGDGSVVLFRLGIVPLDEPAAGEAAIAAEPTAAPVTAPDAIPVDARVVIMVPEARLRTDPSLDGLLVAGLPQGAVLIVTGPPVSGSDLVWYPVQAVDNPALIGFVAADLIALEP